MAALRACTNLQSDDAWRADPFRQNFAIHSDTETIYLIYDRDFRHLSPTTLPKFQEFQSAVQPFIDLVGVRFAHDGWVVRCVLAKLCAGGRIALHEDLGYSLRYQRRIHIPFITDANATLTVGGESLHMQAGEIWEINNTRLHGAENPGPGCRVHLILDWAQPLSAEVLEQFFLENHRAGRNEATDHRSDAARASMTLFWAMFSTSQHRIPWILCSPQRARSRSTASPAAMALGSSAT